MSECKHRALRAYLEDGELLHRCLVCGENIDIPIPKRKITRIHIDDFID